MAGKKSFYVFDMVLAKSLMGGSGGGVEISLGEITTVGGTALITLTNEQKGNLSNKTTITATVDTAPIRAICMASSAQSFIYAALHSGLMVTFACDKTSGACMITKESIAEYTAGNGIGISNGTISVTGMPFLTTAPSSANTDGTLKFVVLTAEPATRYEGYVYLIVEPTLISFTIDSQPYQAEDGMTWAEWVNSEYNTGGFVEFSSGIFDHLYDRQVYLVGDPVAPTDTIYDSSAYSLRQQ